MSDHPGPRGHAVPLTGAPGRAAAPADGPDRGLAVAVYPDRVTRPTPGKARTPSQALRLPDDPERAAAARSTGRSRRLHRRLDPLPAPPAAGSPPAPAPPLPRLPAAPPAAGTGPRPRWWRRLAAWLRPR